MRVLISGYYGMGNLGDEAVLAGLLGELRRLRPEWSLTVLSGDPAATRQDYGVDTVPRASPAQVLHAVRRSDLLVSGGGGLLQDATSLRSLAYYAGVLWLARMAGKPTAILAQSIGPLRTRLGRLLTRQAARRASLVTVRDLASAELLRSIGVTRDVTVTADPAFLVEPSPSAPAEPADLGLCLRAWRGGEKAVEAAIEGVGRWAERENATVAVLSFHEPADAPVAAKALERLGSRGRLVRIYGQPALAAAIIGQFRVVVGARLHALILASAAAVPWVGLAYDPKVAALAEAVGLPALAPDAVAAEQVMASLQQVRQVEGEVRARLRQELSRWREMARRNVELLVSMAEGRASRRKDHQQ